MVQLQQQILTDGERLFSSLLFNGFGLRYSIAHSNRLVVGQTAIFDNFDVILPLIINTPIYCFPVQDLAVAFQPQEVFLVFAVCEDVPMDVIV